MVRTDRPELLFLHPLPFDGRIWESIEARFEDFVTYTPTIYSLGETMQEVAQAILATVEGDRLIVIGNSIGGSCALELAAAASDRVEHLFLIGTKAGHRPEPDFRAWALNLLATDGVEALWYHVWEPLFSSATDPAVISEARARAFAMSDDALAAGISLFHSRPDRNHVIDEWPKPITFVVGSDDIAPRPEVSAEMVQRAKRGVLHIVNDCGHFVPIERPGALVAMLDEVIDTTI